MKKVLLLSMPFCALERPALGLSLLKARLREASVACDVRYLNFPFAELIGFDEYQWMALEMPYTAFAGDWSFTTALYGARPECERGYEEEVLRQTWRLPGSAIMRVRRVASLATYFVDYCMALVPWEEYAVVGFTSTFEQNIASLALAQRLKKEHPEIVIVFGGANWEGEMGLELHRRFPFVDVVCSGEADQSFPSLIERLLGGVPLHQSQAIRGIVYRRADESVPTEPAELVRQLDELPIPDFGDYYRDLAQCTLSSSIIPTLLIETSRGCWWGAKSHCTFCGLNGGTMAFRSKSASRVLRELAYLVDRWQTEMVEAVDNILDMRYFRDVLPSLARAGRPARLFYEVKANLTRSQVELLREAGVCRIQPGIESLNDHILKLMRKGTTALRNIQLLKWCRQFEVGVDWNILYGFPGEKRQDYADTLDLLRSIRFLQPPAACGPVRLDRFSPYYNSPAEFGLANVRPMKPYQYLYPFPAECLRRVAYYFDYDYEPGIDPTGYAAEVIDYVEQWRRSPESGSLSSVSRADGALVLLDTRLDALRRELVLTGIERAAYEFCDELHSLSSITMHLRHEFPQAAFDEAGVRRFLDSLVANRLMVTDGEYYLSLAIPAQPIHRLANTRLLSVNARVNDQFLLAPELAS